MLRPRRRHRHRPHPRSGQSPRRRPRQGRRPLAGRPRVAGVPAAQGHQQAGGGAGEMRVRGRCAGAVCPGGAWLLLERSQCLGGPVPFWAHLPLRWAHTHTRTHRYWVTGSHLPTFCAVAPEVVADLQHREAKGGGGSKGRGVQVITQPVLVCKDRTGTLRWGQHGGQDTPGGPGGWGLRRRSKATLCSKAVWRCRRSPKPKWRAGKCRVRGGSPRAAAASNRRARYGRGHVLASAGNVEVGRAQRTKKVTNRNQNVPSDEGGRSRARAGKAAGTVRLGIYGGQVGDGGRGGSPRRRQGVGEVGAKRKRKRAGRGGAASRGGREAKRTTAFEHADARSLVSHRPAPCCANTLRACAAP